MDTQFTHGQTPRTRSADLLRRLHAYSDSALHTGLLIALLALVGLALYQAMNTKVAVWRLEPVVIHGQAKVSPPAHAIPKPR